MRLAVLISTLFLSTACGAVRPGVGSAIPVTRGVHPAEITGAELDRLTPGENLLQALQHVRPLWFSSRPVQSVFVEGVYQGGVGVLADFFASAVANVKHLDASETTILHGTRFSGPSLDIQLRFGSSRR